MKISVISFTARGDAVNRHIGRLFTDAEVIQNGKTFQPKRNSLSEWTAEAFRGSDIIIFVGAVGIAVRAAAPCLRSKTEDPAVLAVDEAARFVIPLLSGHIGGANAAARHLAGLLGAQAVITTATDINHVFAVDSWAAENGYAVVNPEAIRHISGALLAGETVGLESDFTICGALPKGVVRAAEGGTGICISDRLKKPFANTLNLVPKRYIIGVGSRRGADEDALLALWERIRDGIRDDAVAAVATIELKKDENAVRRLAQRLGAELRLYTAEELNSVAGIFSGSGFVKQVTGTDNVCERAAAASGGSIIVKKTKGSGVTAAVSVMDWSVSFENFNGGCGL